jgi:outer membrane lipoprotein-sorting protein
MKTKSLYYIVFLFAIFSSLNVNAQELDEIIKNHVAAHGGQKNWNAIQSMKITGNYTSFSDVKPFAAVVSKEGKYRSDYIMGQHKVVEVFDGDFAWSINPWWDVTFPYKSLPAETTVMKQRLEFCSPFYNYKEKGYKVEYLGEENVDDVDCYKLKLIREEGVEETWYLNKETFLEFKSLGLRQNFGRLYPAEIYFDDFRKIGDVVIPFFRESSFIHRYRVLEFSNIELNVDIDYNTFIMPKTDEMQKMNSLVGNWSVVYEMQGRRGWHKMDSVDCNINFIENTNFLRGYIEYNSSFPMRKEFNWSFNSKTNRYRLAVLNAYSSNIAIFESEVSDTLFAFENTHIKYDSTYQIGGAVKYEIKDITDNSFLMHVSQSSDNGATWRFAEKFTFTRNKED